MILRVKSSTKTRIHHLQTTYLRVQNREQRICRQTRSDFYERKKQRIKLQRKSAKIDQGQAKRWTFWLNSDVEIGRKSAQWSWRGTSIASTIDDQHSYTVNKKIVRDFACIMCEGEIWAVDLCWTRTRELGRRAAMGSCRVIGTRSGWIGRLVSFTSRGFGFLIWPKLFFSSKLICVLLIYD